MREITFRLSPCFVPYIVGAGFSHHAGLPLTNAFTAGILEARDYSGGPSKLTVDFLSTFIRDAFDHSQKAGAESWPDLEDLFTCVDLSANSGHYFGESFAPGDLRTLRRAILYRILRMLEHKYQIGRKKKSPEWRRLDEFFGRIISQNVGFICMNWDTVIERKLVLNRPKLLVDYGCDAIPANIPDYPINDDYVSPRAYERKMREGRTINAVPSYGVTDPQRWTPVVKIHGSTNWLYCDNCRLLFWFHPDQTRDIAEQLITDDDIRRMRRFLRKKGAHVRTLERLQERSRVKCLCSDKVRLGTRIATFSYRKALDFPMFQKSWFAAEALLRSAKKWVFIGYSLPAADYEFKYLLRAY